MAVTISQLTIKNLYQAPSHRVKVIKMFRQSYPAPAKMRTASIPLRTFWNVRTRGGNIKNEPTDIYGLLDTLALPVAAQRFAQLYESSELGSHTYGLAVYS